MRWNERVDSAGLLSSCFLPTQEREVCALLFWISNPLELRAKQMSHMYHLSIHAGEGIQIAASPDAASTSTQAEQGIRDARSQGV